MTSTDATASGVPYPILAVSGETPVTLDQFVGEVGFTVNKSGAESAVLGVGVRNEDAVRFHEKVGGDGMDVRVWRIGHDAEGMFTAETVSTF
jgi:hypothetical protein